MPVNTKSKTREPEQLLEQLEPQETSDASSIPKKVAERRVIVYKTCIDPTVIKLAVEKIKRETFTKSGLLKPKLEDIRYVSIDKFYEPYVFADGKYSIDYYRKRVFTLEVDENAQEVIILNQTIKPEIGEEPAGIAHGVVKLEAQEHFLHEDKAVVIMDKVGNEVPIEQVPFAPSEEDPKKILNEFSERTGKLNVSPDKEIEILQAKIVKKPSDVDRVASELFEISDRSVIYVPVYEISFENVKTGEKKTVKIDGVTAKVVA